MSFPNDLRRPGAERVRTSLEELGNRRLVEDVLRELTIARTDPQACAKILERPPRFWEQRGTDVCCTFFGVCGGVDTVSCWLGRWLRRFPASSSVKWLRTRGSSPRPQAEHLQCPLKLCRIGRR